jgi:hypothetical protein
VVVLDDAVTAAVVVDVLVVTGGAMAAVDVEVTVDVDVEVDVDVDVGIEVARAVGIDVVVAVTGDVEVVVVSVGVTAVLNVAAVATPLPSVVKVIGLAWFSSPAHPRLTKEALALAARNVNRFVPVAAGSGDGPVA